MTADTVNLDAGITGHRGGRDLPEDLHPGLEAEDIVQQTRRKRYQGCRQEDADG